MASVAAHDGPDGQSVSDSIEESLDDPEFRAEYERLAPYEALARIVIKRRGALGLTQAELATRMGMTASTVSRVESGQHATSPQTLKKLAHAFGARAVFGFEFGPAKRLECELTQILQQARGSDPSEAAEGERRCQRRSVVLRRFRGTALSRFQCWSMQL